MSSQVDDMRSNKRYSVWYLSKAREVVDIYYHGTI